MEDDSEKNNLIRKIKILKDVYPNDIFPNIESLETVGLKTLYDQYIQKIKDEQELSDLRAVYAIFVFMIQHLFTNILNNKSKVEFVKQELQEVSKYDKQQIYNKIRTLFQELKINLEYKIISCLEPDQELIEFYEEIMAIDDNNISNIIEAIIVKERTAAEPIHNVFQLVYGTTYNPLIHFNKTI